MPGESVSIDLLWTGLTEHQFNTLSVDTVFKSAGLTIVAACSDGSVKTYSIPSSNGTGNKVLKSGTSLETKGGPIQALALHDVTKFHSNDVIVADSRGLVTIFCNEQILSRKVVSETCIHCLQIEQDLLGNIAIVTSDSNGHISAFSPYNDLWRIRLTDIKHLKGLGMSPFVRSLLAVRLSDRDGHLHNYILATDNCRHLFVIHQGTVVMVLNVPAPITAMCGGNFLDSKSMETNSPSGVPPTSSSSQQVALGSDTGAIYIMANLEVYYDEFANIQCPITQLTTLPSADPQLHDAILCAGNFNALAVLRNGKEAARYPTPAWINSVVTADIDGDDQLEVIVGCHDSSIHALKLHVS